MEQHFGPIQAVLEEHYNINQKVELLLGLPRELSDAEVAVFEQSLRQQGLQLTAPVQAGIAPWPSTLRMEFRRAARNPREIGVLPLAVLLPVALGAIGITGILGYKVGQVIESIGKNIVPLVLIGGAIWLGLVFMKTRVPAR